MLGFLVPALVPDGWCPMGGALWLSLYDASFVAISGRRPSALWPGPSGSVVYNAKWLRILVASQVPYGLCPMAGDM